MANAKSAVTKLSENLNKGSVKRVEALLEADTGLQARRTASGNCSVHSRLPLRSSARFAVVSSAHFAIVSDACLAAGGRGERRRRAGVSRARQQRRPVFTREDSS